MDSVKTALGILHAFETWTAIFGGVRKTAKRDCWRRHVCPSAWNNSAPTGRIFLKFVVRGLLENLFRDFKFN